MLRALGMRGCVMRDDDDDDNCREMNVVGVENFCLRRDGWFLFFVFADEVNEEERKLWIGDVFVE